MARFEIISKEVRGSVVYDFGSLGDTGDSALHHFLQKAHPGKRIIGVDIKPDAEIQHDLNKPFPKEWEKADTAVAGEVIEHLLHPFSFLKECHELLKPGGKLIITTPNASALNKILLSDEKLDPHHYYCWTRAQLRRIVLLAGFNVEKESMLNLWRRRWFVLKLFVGLFPKFSGEIFLVCRK